MGTPTCLAVPISIHGAKHDEERPRNYSRLLDGIGHAQDTHAYHGILLVRVGWTLFLDVLRRAAGGMMDRGVAGAKEEDLGSMLDVRDVYPVSKCN